jgi:serine/threonine-protein kinase
MEAGERIGAYEIQGLIGKGGMAEVYRVWHSDLRRSEALKLLPPHLAADPAFVRRFLDEAQTAAGLRHPHIATIHSVSNSSGPLYYFTMELVEGGDLSDLLGKRSRLSLPEALPLLRQVAEALDYAHRQGVVHRDVKPGNVLLGETLLGETLLGDALLRDALPGSASSGEGAKGWNAAEGWNAKVVDFGIAKAQEAEGGKRLTKTGMILGTPEYMAPEQATGGAISGKTDQYALGVMAYEMACGRPPFGGEEGTSEIGVIMSHVREEVPDPLVWNPELGEGGKRALLKALAKSPDDRFPSCGAFVQSLQSSSDSLSGTVSDPPIKKNRRLPLAVGAVLLVGALLVGMGVRNSSHPAPESEENKSPVVEKRLAPSVKVPDLYRLSFTAAKTNAEGEGLKLMPEGSEFSEDAPKDSVLRQEPEAGKLTASGGEIRVVLSRGRHRVNAPDLIHLARSDAQEKAAGQGLLLRVEDSIPSDAAPEGYVLRQNPEPGALVDSGETVSVVCSSGPPATPETSPSSSVSYRTVQNDRLGFQVDAPEGWTQRVKTDGSYTNTAFISPSDPHLFIFVDVTEHYPDKPVREGWLKLEKRFMKKYDNRYERISLEDGYLDGKPSATWIFKVQKKGEPVTERMDTGINGGGNGYAVMGVAPEGQFNAWRGVFERVTQSLHLRDPRL